MPPARWFWIGIPGAQPPTTGQRLMSERCAMLSCGAVVCPAFQLRSTKLSATHDRVRPDDKQPI